MKMLVAYGPNSVSSVCMFFENEQQANKFLDDAFQSVPEGTVSRTKTGGLYIDKESWDGDETFWHRFFTKYYDGCGGVGVLELEDVPAFQTAFTGWDLD